MVFNHPSIHDIPNQSRRFPVNGKYSKIYIVDDDESVRMALKRLFKSVGLEVQTFASAVDFLNVAYPDYHGCLILDVRMPGILGLELQEYLKAEKITMPVIFISAYPDEKIRTIAMQRGAQAFLRKPFDDDTLLAEVYSAIGLKSQHDFIQHG